MKISQQLYGLLPSVDTIIRRFLFAFLTATILYAPAHAFAACSPYIGQATLNEFFKDQSNMSNDPDDFAEVKILNGSIPSSTYLNWTVKICEDDDAGNNNDADDCSGDILLSSFTNTTLPWLVLKGAGLPTQLGQHINFKTGFDAALLDENGDLIDYITVDGYSKAISGITCPLSNLVYDYTASSPGASDKTIFRSPDGTGVWDSAPSATAPPTEDTTNDPLPPPPSGESYPYVTINNVSLSTPGTALFTVSLTDATGNPTTFSQAVTVSYYTQDGTATAADNDYDPVPIGSLLTVTIAAGQTSTTLTVDSPLSDFADTNEYFYAVLQAVQDSAANGGNPNAVISKHYGTATLDGPIGEWTFDSCSISAPFDVKDTSGNNYHATPHNGTTTSLGRVCSAGDFDGNDDYVSIPGFPNLNTSFTISAWINPAAIDNDQRIFADDESNSGGFAFSLGDGGDGRLRFFSRNVNPIILDSSAVITPGNWYHVVAVHDSVNKTRQIFVNGADVTGGPQPYTGTWGSDGGLASIGGETDGAGSEATAQWRFDGLIDEVKVYYRALSAAEISSYYADPNPNNRICPICIAPSCEPFLDQFSSQSYSRQDGTLNWTTNWIETGDTGGASGGDILITNGELRLQGDGNSPSIEREVDLSGYDSATLSFDYRNSLNWESGDNITIYFSNDGGSSWTLQDTISNDQPANTYSTVLATSNLTSNFRIRFVEGANNWREYFYIDNVQIDACKASTLHHIRIEHDGEGLTCDGEQVIVKACVDSSCTAEYSESVTATLTPDGDTVTFSGHTTGYVRQSTAGIATLDANTISPIPTNGVRCFIGAAETCNMNFVNSGFRFTDGATNPITIGTQIAGKSSGVTPGNQVIALQAVRTDTNTGACVGAFPDGSDVNVEMASQCNNPTTCIATSKVNITNNSNTTPINNNPDTAVSSYTSVPLRFTSDSQAILNFSYPDVGQISLYARYNIPDSSGTPTGNYMSGSSNLFVVKPAGFVITSILRPDDTANPANTTATDTPYFVKAGTSFKATIEARDINGNITPNYGNETDPEGILLTPSLVTGLGLTNNPAITNGTISGNEFGASGAVSDADGVATVTNLSWPEVGIITLTPLVTGSDGNDYLDAGSVAGTTTGNVGRFTPAYFDVSSTESCTPVPPATTTNFTYSGQGFTTTITARHNGGGITQNYDGDFVRSPQISNAGDATYFTNNDFSNLHFSNGIGTRNDVTYTFASKETPELAMTNIRAKDDDDISSATFTEGSNLIRSGRARLENVFGSELSPLSMTFRTEYYSDNGTPAPNTGDDGFILNTDDSCTTYDATAGTLANYTGNLSSGETTVTGAVAVTPGLYSITFSAPGPGNEGSVNLLTDNIDGWLTFPWGIDCDGDTVNDTGACGTASFGLFRGDDRIIYQREVF